MSLRIDPGQFTGILGPNGAGKTTLVEMIEGIQQPDRGDIRVMGMSWKDSADEIHRIIGLSLQETRFIDKLTLKETLRLFASFYGLREDRVEEIIDLVGLDAKRDAFTVNLSGGQRQRLALGIALINRPRILLLDEPTTGLDPNARREIWDILLNLKAGSETSLILTTHYMEEAEKLCDAIIIMDNGEILREGTLDQLLRDSGDEKYIEFSVEPGETAPISRLMGNCPFAVDWDAQNRKGNITLTDMENQLPDFLSFLKNNRIHLKNLECRRQTLDDLFIAMTGRRLTES